MSPHLYSSHINIGMGLDVSIAELVDTISVVVEYKGEIRWDASKPDGAPRKLMNNSCIERMGWTSKTSLVLGESTIFPWLAWKLKLPFSGG